MKDSGVEWIGEIPEGWDVVKIKYLSSLYGRIGWQGLTSHEYQESGPYLITGTDFINGHINWDTCVHITLKRYEEATQIQIKNDDLLITKDGTIGKVAIVDELDEKASLNSGVLLIRPINSRRYTVKFCYYILLSDIFWKWYESNQTGNSTIKHLYQEKFKEFSYPLPPLPVQYAISSHLDTKSSLIDSTIEKEREIITKLKEYRQAVITEAVTKGIHAGVPMKDSGVEWIGEIPSDWSIGKIKYTTSKIGSGKTPKGGSETYSEEGILFLRSQNIYDTGLNIEEATFISENIDEEMANTRVYSDDVLLNITGASIGRCCIYPSKMNPANVNQHVCIIRVIVNTMIPGYVHYFWVSSSGQTSIDIYQSGANREGLNFEQIGNTFMPYPSLPEQQDIVDYLDAKCSAIDATIQKRELAIEKLTAYKQSLIYECVTGKMEVLG